MINVAIPASSFENLKAVYMVHRFLGYDFDDFAEGSKLYICQKLSDQVRDFCDGFFIEENFLIDSWKGLSKWQKRWKGFFLKKRFVKDVGFISVTILLKKEISDEKKLRIKDYLQNDLVAAGIRVEITFIKNEMFKNSRSKPFIPMSSIQA